MKTYEKPRLMAISLSANDLLCGCVFDAMGPDVDPVIAEIYALLEGIVDPSNPNNFAEGDGCKSIVPISGYCKMTPEGGEIVFAS